eukprot:scaffold296580_cov22-Tisochrysis_lutea.AAC.3
MPHCVFKGRSGEGGRTGGPSSKTLKCTARQFRLFGIGCVQVPLGSQWNASAEPSGRALLSHPIPQVGSTIFHEHGVRMSAYARAPVIFPYAYYFCSKKEAKDLLSLKGVYEAACLIRSPCPAVTHTPRECKTASADPVSLPGSSQEFSSAGSAPCPSQIDCEVHPTILATFNSKTYTRS